MKVRFSYLPSYPKMINITPTNFAKKLAKAMKEIGSSHVFFIMQQAYGEIGYEECEKIWAAVLNEPEKKTVKKSLTKKVL